MRVTILDLAVVARAGWKAPFDNGKLLDHLFTMKRKKDFDRTGAFTCGASEMIILVPLVLYFLETENSSKRVTGFGFLMMLL